MFKLKKKYAFRLIPLKKIKSYFWDAHTLLYIFHKTWHLYCCRVYTPVNVNLNNSFFFTGFLWFMLEVDTIHTADKMPTVFLVMGSGHRYIIQEWGMYDYFLP